MRPTTTTDQSSGLASRIIDVSVKAVEMRLRYWWPGTLYP